MQTLQRIEENGGKLKWMIDRIADENQGLISQNHSFWVRPLSTEEIETYFGENKYKVSVKFWWLC